MAGPVTSLTDEQARAAAGDPASPAGLLARLAARDPGEEIASADEEIWRLVAANPATPIEALLVLARQHPEEVSHNPSLRRHLVADPGLLGRLGNWQLAAALAGDEAVVAAYGAELARSRHPAVREELAANRAIPSWILEELQARPDWPTLCGLARNPSVAPAALGAMATGEHRLIRELAAQNPALPAGLLALLRRAGADPGLRYAGQAPGALSLADRAGLLAEGPFARELLAVQPDLSPQEMDRLLHDKDFRVRRQLAGNVALPLTSLALLASDPEAAVRERVASNPAVVPSLLESLAADPEAFVRKAAGRNLCASVELVRGLAASDSEEEVREAMALVLRQRGEAEAG